MSLRPRDVGLAALIFDFDGVIADSEALANLVLAEAVSRLGNPTTLDEALARYSGRRWVEAMGEIERHIGRPLPGGFGDELIAATLARFRSDLKEVEGAAAFIAAFSAIPRCIASSSSRERLGVCLEVLGLEEVFGQNVFSAEMVSRGKPHPDLFLMAADRMGVPPEACLVIEDSANGIVAASNAGMTSIGLCAASHIRAGHDLTLRDAGASYLAASWPQAHEIAARLFRVAVED